MKLRAVAAFVLAWVFVASLAVAGAISRPPVSDEPHLSVQDLALGTFVPHVPSTGPSYRCARPRAAVVRGTDFVF